MNSRSDRADDASVERTEQGNGRPALPLAAVGQVEGLPPNPSVGILAHETSPTQPTVTDSLHVLQRDGPVGHERVSADRSDLLVPPPQRT